MMGDNISLTLLQYLFLLSDIANIHLSPPEAMLYFLSQNDNCTTH